MHKRKLIKKGQAGLSLSNSPTSFNFSKQFGNWSQGNLPFGFNSQILGNFNTNLLGTGTESKNISNLEPLKASLLTKNLNSTVKLPTANDMSGFFNSITSNDITATSNGLGTTQGLSNFLGSKLGGLSTQLGASLLETLPTKDNEINSTDATMGNIRDSANKTLMSGIAGPWGIAAGAANSLIGKLGGSTDASSGLGAGNDILNATTSLIPGLGFLTGKIKGVDQSLDLQESSGFSGLKGNINKANKNSGKILFGRGKAKSNIADAQFKADTATSLIKTSNEDFKAATNSTDMFRLKNQLSMNNNSYLYNGALSAKDGARIIRIAKSQKKNKFEEFRKTLPKPLQDTVYYRLESLWNFGGKPKNFEDAKKLELFENVDGEFHAPSVIKNEKADEYIFLKVPSHPSVNKEIDWYESEDGKEFRDEYDLDKSGEVWKYLPKTKKEKESFALGGKMNLIPEGALHARKHNLDGISDITKKGIPIISEESGGVVQHAEIEREEIIFTKEVTQKLEELRKEGTPEAAIKAGILLSQEIIENTDDRANLMKTIQE